jgi:hypothetical protein
MKLSGNREFLNAANEVQKNEQESAKLASENLNTRLSEARSNGSKSPEKGFFNKMFGSFKNAVEGWSGKYSSKSKDIQTTNENFGYNSIDDIDRKKLTIKKAKEANTSTHSGAEVAREIEKINANIAFESRNPDRVNLPKIVELQNQLSKWESMQGKIYDSLDDKSLPNTKRHDRVMEEIEIEKVSLDTRIDEGLSEIENGVTLEGEMETRFSDYKARRTQAFGKKSQKKYLDSIGQTKTETVNFPVDEGGKSVLTREVFDKYSNLSIQELGAMINNSSKNENSIVKDAQAMILYRTRNPFVNQVRNASGGFVEGNKGEYLKQGNFDDSDYERYASENNIPFKSKNSIPSTVTKSFVPQSQVSPNKEANERQPTNSKTKDSIWNKTASTLLSQVGELTSINFERGKNLLSLLGGREKIPTEINQEYVSVLIQKFDNGTMSDAQRILKQFEKDGKLSKLAENCTEEQLENIRSYANDYQKKQLQNYNLSL